MAATPPRPRSTTRRPRRPGRPRSEKGGSALREALLDAATGLAVERGFDAVGLREIAARAGASPGMISYYFGDREGLYESLFERAFERVGAEVERLLEGGEGGPADLDDLTRLHVGALSRDPWIPQLIAREVLARHTRVRDLFASRVTQGPLRVMTRWIELQQRAGRLRADLDPLRTALSIASLAVFPFLFAPVLGEALGVKLDDSAREELIAHNQKLISHGIRARPERFP